MTIKFLKKSLNLMILFYTIDISNAQWNQNGADINGEAADDESGFVVSLFADGIRVAIGARLNNNANGSLAGHVRVYEYSVGNWLPIGADKNEIMVNYKYLDPCVIPHLLRKPEFNAYFASDIAINMTKLTSKLKI